MLFSEKNYLFKGKFLFYFIILFVFTLFSSVFILSLFKIVNMWSFSQAHINYFYGFTKRGLFGTLMLLSENFFSISSKKLFAIFFIILTTLNIYLFFKIIKIYSSNFLLFLFLSLNPTLIMFSFNDLGGYQRFDMISILLMLLHCVFAYSNNVNYNIELYKKKLFFIIFPLIIISSFIHEIQIWSLPLHCAITINTAKKNYKKIILNYLIFIIPIIIIFFLPVKDITMQKMIADLSARNLFTDAIIAAASTKGNLEIINYELNTNLFNFYNFKINLFFIIVSTIPYYFFITYLKSYNFLKNKKINQNYLLVVIFPYLSLFAIGDTGRWINLISFTSLTFISQFPLKKKVQSFKLTKQKNLQYLINFIYFIIILIYIFFIRMPHCCDLQKKGITIWGGISEKILAFSKIISKDKDDFYNINKRFKE